MKKKYTRQELKILALKYSYKSFTKGRLCKHPNAKKWADEVKKELASMGVWA